MGDECWAVRDWLFMWADRGEPPEAVVAGALAEGVRLNPREVARYLSRLRRPHGRPARTQVAVVPGETDPL